LTARHSNHLVVISVPCHEIVIRLRHRILSLQLARTALKPPFFEALIIVPDFKPISPVRQHWLQRRSRHLIVSLQLALSPESSVVLLNGASQWALFAFPLVSTCWVHATPPSSCHLIGELSPRSVMESMPVVNFHSLGPCRSQQLVNRATRVIQTTCVSFHRWCPNNHHLTPIVFGNPPPISTHDLPLH
jgi:hypothetical protein